MDIPSEPRDKVLFLLKRQRRMTAEQIALADNQPRRGGKLKPHIPKEGAKEYPPFIRRTHRLLERMYEDGLLEFGQEHNNQPKFWMLSDKVCKQLGISTVIYPSVFWTRKHEEDVANLFVRYLPHATHWDTEWGVAEAVRLNIPVYKVHYDARMVLGGKVYLWEVDRGTEDLEDKLYPKIRKYIEFAKSLPYGSFQVLITMQKYRRESLENRMEYLTGFLQDCKRGTQFLLAPHQAVLNDPLGTVWVNPFDPDNLYNPFQ